MDPRSILPPILAVIVQELMQELIDSSSSESDDEDSSLFLYIIQKHLKKYNTRRRVQRIENYVEEVLPGLTKEEFKTHFRMSPETFDYVLTLIEPRLRRTIHGRPMISPRKQFLVTLWRLATPDSFRSICERFNVGRSTALYITRRVIQTLVELAPVIIKWPTDEQLNEVWAGFENISAFPKVIGAIDGTYINIPAPKKNPESYINRKGHYSIQLQAICNHKGLFIHCYVGHVGSVHDQRVFRQSEVQDYLGDVTKFPQDSHLVGDLTYKLHENLLTPYRDNGHLSRHQQNYNFCHASARIVIERAFGLLKGRFRSLSPILAMDRTDLIPMHILACCVLHNICLMKEDELNFEINEDEMIDVTDNTENIPPISHEGVAKRNLICETLRIRHV